MPTLQIGPLRVHMSGGTDRHGGGPGPAVLLCHGFGAPGDDLVSAARVIQAGPAVRWFFPEAPIELQAGFGTAARAWWPVDFEQVQTLMERGRRDDLTNATPPGLGAARVALEATLDELERGHGVERERLLLGGFSQGAMLTTEVALFSERPFAGLAVLSGALVSRSRWEEAARTTGPKLHALMTHGRADPLLPFSGAEALRDMLQNASANVTWVPFNGGHEMPAVAIDRLGAFARDRFAAG